MALVGCGSSESTFEPIEEAEAPDESAYESGGDPYSEGGAAEGGDAAPEGSSSDG
jgi:hypothetical protein